MKKTLLYTVFFTAAPRQYLSTIRIFVRTIIAGLLLFGMSGPGFSQSKTGDIREKVEAKQKKPEVKQEQTGARQERIEARQERTGVLQEKGDSAILDISGIRFSSYITQVSFLALPNNSVPADSIPTLENAPELSESYKYAMPAEIVEKTIYLKFPLYNSSDSTRYIYFYPGIYFEKTELLKMPLSPAGTKVLATRDFITNYVTDSAFLPIVMAPKEKAWFLARLKPVRTSVNDIVPQVFQKDFISFFRNNVFAIKSSINTLTYLTSGILLMMIFYSLAVYLQDLDTVFLYYSGYTAFIGLLLFLKSFLYNSITPFNYFFEGWLDFMIQGTALIFYLIFVRKFLDTQRNHTFLEKMMVTAEIVIIIGMLSYSILYFFTDKFVLLNHIENITKQFLLVTGIVFIVYGLIKRSPLMNFLVAGQIILTLFSGISLLLIISRFRVVHVKNSIFNDSLLYYEVGLTLELICFLAGLAYKNRKEIIERVKESERLKQENERIELGKQVAVLEAKQDERNRISVDMHDELGSGVTAIRLMSEIVKSKMKEQTLPEIEKISQSANELLIKMNAIIWTMTSSNDTLENLIAYIRSYAVEFFENTSVDCYFNMPSVIPAREISGEKRRNIFLCVKEALNNVLKHSQASAVKIHVTINDNLIIAIQDDGVGINMEKIRKFGNGLNNMRKRMVSIEGECHIVNDRGTTMTFQLAL